MHDRVGTELIERAKHVNIVTYLRAKHPGSIQFAAHPDKPQYKCLSLIHIFPGFNC